MNRPDREQDDFARLVHHLRGPLMPLRTAAWLLRNELAGSERGCELADIVDRQSARLARMLDELAEWRRDGPAQAASLRPMELALALDFAIGSVAGCASEPRYAGAAATAQLLLDPPQFDRMLRTLVAHAMARQAGDSPAIDAWLDDGRVRIRVRDRGAPLDAQAREALFERPQPKPFDEGLGLQLLVARRIAEAHGGTLAVDAADEAGLAVVCTVPLPD